MSVVITAVRRPPSRNFPYNNTKLLSGPASRSVSSEVDHD